MEERERREKENVTLYSESVFKSQAIRHMTTVPFLEYMMKVVVILSI